MYEKCNAEVTDYFGSQESFLLVDHIAHLNSELPILDIGAGQGRNVFYLARQGFYVDAIEPTEAGNRAIRKRGRG